MPETLIWVFSVGPIFCMQQLFKISSQYFIKMLTIPRYQTYRLVGGRLDQRSINRRCHGTITFGH